VWTGFVQVSRQLSQLGVTDGPPPPPAQQSPRPTVGVTTGSGPAGSRRAVARQPPPIAFVRRQSAPGPVGQAVEPGSRKPWSYTPSFGVASGAGRSPAVPSRPM